MCCCRYCCRHHRRRCDYYYCSCRCCRIACKKNHSWCRDEPISVKVGAAEARLDAAYRYRAVVAAAAADSYFRAAATSSNGIEMKLMPDIGVRSTLSSSQAWQWLPSSTTMTKKTSSTGENESFPDRRGISTAVDSTLAPRFRLPMGTAIERIRYSPLPTHGFQVVVATDRLVVEMAKLRVGARESDRKKIRTWI